MDQPEAVLLSDEVLVNGTKSSLTLTVDGLLRWSERGNIRCLSVEKEVLGFSAIDNRIKVRTFVEELGGVGSCFGGGTGGLMRKNFVFEPLSQDSLRIWCQKLQEFLDSLGRPKKLVVLVNPFGGRRSASKIFINDVKPILEDASVEYTLLETKYQLHAKEIAKTLDIAKYDGIICVSGDGILVEVMNGLLEREDWETAMKMPVGVVPAGTGNGMIKSLLHSVGEPCTAPYATLAAIRGHKRSLDVATIWQGETTFFSVLMLAWGLVADIDIESEKYRWMGSARIDFYALQRVLWLRKYNGCLSFVPAPGFEDVGEPNKDGTMGPVMVQQHGYQGPKVNFESSSWRKLNGPFVSVWLHNVPWGAENTMAAPDAKFDDGYLDLIVIRDCPKLPLMALMTDLNNGSHVKSPYVLYIKVKAFILEPGPRTDDPTKEGIIDSDGEVLARGKGTYNCNLKSLMSYGKLQIVVDQGLATLFTPV